MANTTRRTRVLVFPCGTEIGLEIHRALSDSIHVQPVGASSVVSHHGRMVYAEHHDGLPFHDDPALRDALNQLIAETDIDLIYPAHDDVVYTLSRMEGLDCPIVGPGPEAADVCRSKGSTYAQLKDVVPTPRVYCLDESFPLPVFLKPDRGQGSRGVAIAHSRKQAEAALERDPSLLLMEYLPGREYTVDCFSDGFGKLRFAAARQRIRQSSGIATHTRQVDLPQAVAWAEAIHQKLGMRGAWFFQLKENAAGEPVLMEVAGRVSGSSGVFRAQGVNLPLLSVFDALGMPVDILQQELRLDMDRALINRYAGIPEYREVYIDLDDLVVRGGNLDPLTVAFLAQCRNRGVRVTLLTRHAGDPRALLEHWGISAFFDALHHLRREERKSDYVQEKESIFIDDSYAERREVHERRGVPVFGVDAIEALLDWRR